MARARVGDNARGGGEYGRNARVYSSSVSPHAVSPNPLGPHERASRPAVLTGWLRNSVRIEVLTYDRRLNPDALEQLTNRDCVIGAAHEKYGPLVAGKNTRHPDTFPHLAAKLVLITLESKWHLV